MDNLNKLYSKIKNESSFDLFNNVFSESTKHFKLKPCDFMHPLKQILIYKDGHDNIFDDKYIINEDKPGFDARFAGWISSLPCPAIIEKADILRNTETSWKFYPTLRNCQNCKLLIVAIFDWKDKEESKRIWKAILRDYRISQIETQKIAEAKSNYYFENKAAGLLERYETFDLMVIDKKFQSNTIIIHEFTHYIQDILNIYIDESEAEKFEKLKVSLTPMEKKRLATSFELNGYTIDELIDQFFSSYENDVYFNSNVAVMLKDMQKDKEEFANFLIERIETYDYNKTYSEQWEQFGMLKYDKIALLFLLLSHHFDMFWNKIKNYIETFD